MLRRVSGSEGSAKSETKAMLAARESALSRIKSFARLTLAASETGLGEIEGEWDRIHELSEKDEGVEKVGSGRDDVGVDGGEDDGDGGGGVEKD